MGIKSKISRFFIKSNGIKQFQKTIDRESQLLEIENSIKSNEDSPTRFEIVFESIKHPPEKVGLFNSISTMRKIPSIMRNINKSLTSIIENPTHPKFTISKTLLQEFEKYAKSLGIAAIGYTKLPRNLIFKNKAVLHDNAIVLSFEMDKDKIELAPSAKTSSMIMKTYDDLGKCSNKLTEYLRKQGYSAHAGHPLGGLVLYPPLAELAGIGYHGRHGLIITPEHGSRVRLTAIYTNIENLPFSKENPHEWIKDFCGKCGRCIRKCPGFAIYDKPIIHENGIITHVENENCFPVFLDYHACTICVKECPFSRLDYKKLEKQYRTKTLNPDLI